MVVHKIVKCSILLISYLFLFLAARKTFGTELTRGLDMLLSAELKGSDHGLARSSGIHVQEKTFLFAFRDKRKTTLVLFSK